MLKKDLLSRYKKGQVSTLEKQLVEEWYEQHQEQLPLDDQVIERHIRELDEKIERIGRMSFKSRFLRIIPWAAAVLFMVSVFLYHYDSSNSNGHDAVTAMEDVPAPTGDNAIVTLKDKTQITLDAISTGDTVEADGYLITRRISGEIQYIADKSPTEIVFNTIETGIGGSTSIILSDGTKVWLNARSKVTYPTVFSSDIREVYLEGEGYFEVTSSADLSEHPPFLVNTKQHTLRVYGTRFNINTYNDAYIATLLEGKIGLMKTPLPLHDPSDYEDEIFLEPHQQYTEDSSDPIRTLSDPERILDWKNNYFYLTGQTLNQISEKLARWYGVSFIMDSTASERKFFGQISRKKNLSDVLELMSEVGALSFKLQNNTVLVEHKK